jgi:hypothetical protein
VPPTAHDVVAHSMAMMDTLTAHQKAGTARPSRLRHPCQTSQRGADRAGGQKPEPTPDSQICASVT